jgi:phospholipid/cholesterol/gamma-HCH transport system ATP-binding protein
MYDEPFTGQDPIAMGVLVSLIKNLNQALNTTSLLVSHDIHETVSIADKIYVIADGKVIGEGAPDVLASEDSSRIRQFMHGSPDGPVPFHYPAVPGPPGESWSGQRDVGYRVVGCSGP